jgi:HSP20 family protein
MAIARWNPFRELSSLQSRMDRLMDDLVETESNVIPTYRLPIDVAEKGNSYVIKAPTPGFKPEDVEVTVTGDVLSIKATRKEEKTEKESSFLRREMALGNLERQIVLPSDARPDNINAKFSNGVLTVEVPREPKPKPHKIEVRSEDQKEGQKSQKQMAGAA